MNRIFRLIILLLSLLLLGGHPGYAQEHSYTHYDVHDGLAGSTVYSMAQDKDGFIWFGTETGLSRFDGTRFKNYTTVNGLPDNEILKIFVDSKNRIWLVPFRKSVAYIWHGRIHNKENDPTLRKLKLHSELKNIAEDPSGNIIIQQIKSIEILDISGSVTELVNYSFNWPVILNVGLSSNDEFRLGLLYPQSNYIMNVVGNKLIPVKRRKIDSLGWIVHYLGKDLDIIEERNGLIAFSFKDSVFTLKQPIGFMNVSRLNDSLIALNTNSNSLLFNIYQRKVIDTLIKRQAISSVMEDSEGNYWLSTLGKGVFRMGSRSVVNYFFKWEGNNLPVFCIAKIDSVVYFGGDHFLLCRKDMQNGTIKRVEIANRYTRGRIMFLIKGPHHKIIGSSDAGLLTIPEKSDSVEVYSLRLASKTLQVIDDSLLLESDNGSAMILGLSDFHHVRMLSYERSLCSLRARSGNYYLACLDGLRMVDKNWRTHLLGEQEKALSNRVVAMQQSADGILWMATDGGGLVGYNENKVVAQITEKEGMTSNICRSLFVAPDAIWVGTDKGLNKVTPKGKDYQVISYTISDGLSSDMINAVFVDGHDVYVGNSEGVTGFNENRLTRNSYCLLRFTEITVSGKQWNNDTSGFTLSHKDNNIRFDFVGISYKSAGSIQYKYRLAGLDSSWRYTRETNLNYPSLPSGDYELQLVATNKFGIESDMRHVRFTVAKLIWEKLWFRLSILLVLGTLILVIFNIRVRRVREREMEKAGITMKITELEQMALRSQMNPHFIFNCLNSIQQYVIYQDVLGANAFITQFSHLIRQTLNFSSRSSITLEEELEYLSTYLELEKRRFENKFIYDIIVAENVDKERCHIPPMILQPYIENAIRHGIGLRRDKNGKILISIDILDGYLVCMVEDNGVGRKLAAKYKSNNAISYQSVGMSLVAKRVEMINKTSDIPVMITVTDMEDVQGIPTGTRIILRFPLGTVLQ